MRLRLMQKNLKIALECETEELLSMKSNDKNLLNLINKLYFNEIDYILYLEQETNQTFIIKKV